LVVHRAPAKIATLQKSKTAACFLCLHIFLHTAFLAKYLLLIKYVLAVFINAVAKIFPV